MNMHKLATISALALALGASSLQAQLVETPKSTPRKPASKSAATAARGGTQKVLDKKLSDFGITPRSLGTWKTTGGKPSLSFLEIHFRKIERPVRGSWERPVDEKSLVADGFVLNGFQIQGADYLEGGTDYRTLALLRLNRNSPQASKDGGHTWLDGEKVGEAWVFAFDNETLTLSAADEAFSPTAFNVLALERGTVIRTDQGSVSYKAPYFYSAVVAIAEGKGEVQGLIKFPGTSFVIPFRGIRHQDRWVARALGTQVFQGPVFVGTSGSNPNPGMGPMETPARQYPQIEITKAHLQIGTGAFIDYAQDGDTVGQLRCALEFDLTKGVHLTELAMAYQENLSRSLWTRSDEEGSFSREAEKAYIRAGLSVWFFTPRRETGFDQGGGRTLNPILDRLKTLGGKAQFIPIR